MLQALASNGKRFESNCTDLCCNVLSARTCTSWRDCGLSPATAVGCTSDEVNVYDRLVLTCARALCRDLYKLEGLRPFAVDPAFLKEWAAVKRVAKVKAAAYLFDKTGITVSPDSMFDVQVCAQRHSKNKK